MFIGDILQNKMKDKKEFPVDAYRAAEDMGRALMGGAEGTRRTVHLANKINNYGQASAICFDPPRAIDMSRATWVFAPENYEAVTCPRCRKIMQARGML